MTPSSIVIDYPKETTSAPMADLRIALVIVSFVLLVPLCAITAALVVPLTDSLPAWDGAIITTCAQTLVCAAVAATTLAIGAGKERRNAPTHMS